MASPKDLALAACRQLLEPVVAILLRNGITYKDMQQLCKQIYVKVASRDYGIRGRETNQSRISLMTGIDRKEVARIKDTLENNEASDNAQRQQDRLTRVISGWYQSAEFTGEGKPLPLSLEGEGASFAQLVKRFGGDMPASAILKEFKRTQVVEEDATGLLHLKKHHFTPSASDPAALMRACSVINDLASALHHNLYLAPNSKSLPTRFERRATSTAIPVQLAGEFHTLLEREGQAFLERIDTWLTQHELPSDQAQQSPSLRLGVGAYLIESQPSQAAPAPLAKSASAQAPSAETSAGEDDDTPH